MKHAMLIVPALLASAAWAADVPGHPPVVNGAVTLDEAVAIAMKENPGLRRIGAEVRAAEARASAARAERRPVASGVATLSGGSQGSILSSSPLSGAAMLMAVPRGAGASLNAVVMAPLSTGGRLAALERAAVESRAATAWDRAALAQEVIALTRAAHHTVLARREVERVWTDRLSADEERLRRDRVRLEQEQIPAFYVQRGEAEVAASRQQLTNARRDLELARVDLKAVMGVDSASRLDAAGTLEAPDTSALIAAGGGAGAEGMPALDGLLGRARESRPDIAAARLRERAAQAEADAVRGSFRPQVDAMAMGGVMAMKGDSAETGASATLVASLPLITSGLKAARVAEAEAARERAERERERLERDVEREVQQTWWRLSAARENVSSSREAVRAARAEYEAVRLRYEVGRGVLVEELDALAARTQAETNVIQALYDLNLAYEDALRAVGLITGP